MMRGLRESVSGVEQLRQGVQGLLEKMGTPQHSAHMSMFRRWMDTRFISRIVTLMKPEKVWLPSERTLIKLV